VHYLRKSAFHTRYGLTKKTRRRIGGDAITDAVRNNVHSRLIV